MVKSKDKELELIRQLRQNVQDLELCEESLSNANLIRWIRARNHVLKDAEIMFRNYIKWFDGIKLSSIFDQKVPKEVSEVYLQTFCGFDYSGCPIGLCPVGQIDFAKLMKEGYKDEVFIQQIQYLERNAYFIRRLMAERQIKDEIILLSSITDLENLGWKQLMSTDVVNFIRESAKVVEMFYPETMQQLIIINAPRVFAFVWKLLKPFLSEVTMAKMQIYGSNRREWQEALLKFAPKESLPKKYGGILPDDVDILPKCEDCVPKKRGGH